MSERRSTRSERPILQVPGTARFPDIDRPDVGTVLVSRWSVDRPEHQWDAGEAALDVWEHLPWPEGLLSHSVFLGTDGTTVLQYSQWTGDAALHAFTQAHLAERAQNAYEAVPGLERAEAVKYRLYRSMPSDDPARQPGCIVIVSFETDGPEWQRRFVDDLIDTVEHSTAPPHPGMIASHFHRSVDGTRVLNYAAFTDERAHDEVLQTRLREDGEVPRLIDEMAGVTPRGYERYRLYKSGSPE